MNFPNFYLPTSLNISSVSPYLTVGFLGSSAGKESACSAGDPDLIPGLGRSPGGGQGNSPQYCLENPHGQRSPAVCSPWGCKELDTTE